MNRLQEKRKITDLSRGGELADTSGSDDDFYSPPAKDTKDCATVQKSNGNNKKSKCTDIAGKEAAGTSGICPKGSQSTSSKSKFDQYFEIKSEENKGKIAVCRICRSKLKRVELKMTQDNTSGLKKHLKSCHVKEHSVMFPKDIPDIKEDSSGGHQRSIAEMITGKQKCEERNNDFGKAIVDWTAQKYLPFRFFDDDDTQKFFKMLNPTISFPKRTKLRQMVLDRYNKMRKAVLQLLKQNKSNLSFTIDGWTSVAGKSYYGITTHFIDDKWEYQSLVIDFVPSNGNHTGRDIAEVFMNTLKSFELEHKLQGVTVDNASANTKFIEELSKMLPSFDSTDQHFRCIAHVLNLAVQDLLRTLSLEDGVSEDQLLSIDSDDEDFDFEEENKTSITKMRTLIKKIKKSEQLRNKFRSACEAAGEPSLNLVIDVPTRWNSTDDMIATAINVKRGISILCDSISDLKRLKITESEWTLLENVHKVLKNFKVLTTKLGGENYVTLPLVTVPFNLLLDKLEKMMEILDNKPGRNDRDEKLLLAYQAARNKMVKHYRLANWIYCAVLILDPRHKCETFAMTPWGKEMQEKSLLKFEEIFKTYFERYSTQIQSMDQENLESSALVESDEEDLLDVYALYKQSRPSTGSSSSQQEMWRKELEDYLQQPRSPSDVNILTWWKANESTFPLLSKMARDLLSIPATSVPAERLFSRAALTIRKHRNRLGHDSARSLLCVNSWVTCNLASQIKNLC